MSSRTTLVGGTVVGATDSFDVFDTVLTRRTGRPHAVYSLVADRLSAAQHLIAKRSAFIAERRRAEPRLHSLTRRPPTLAEVYREVSRALNLPPAQADLFVAAEQAVEMELSVAVPGAAELLDAARVANPNGLIFVSDTPHAGEFVRELLCRQGLCRADDRVFTSADVGASKSRGGLFTRVSAMLEADPSTLRHTGDNPRADVRAAMAEGWTGVLRPAAQLNRYERLLEKHADASAELTSWLAGGSRLARLHAQARGVAAPVAEVAAGVTAPVLVGYSIWLAAQVHARGLRRLYFVARDGEMLLEVARPVLAVLAPAVECRYLYGSRHAWVRAGACESNDVLSAWLAPKADSTLRTASLRAGIDVEQVCRVLGRDWARPQTADCKLSTAQAEELSSTLLREPLLSSVLRRAREDGELTVEYLRQEGLAEDVPAALVDLGWRGHSARAFDHLMRRAGGRPIEHLFLGLYAGARVVRRSDAAPSLSAWLFDRAAAQAPDTRNLERPNVLMEMFCAGTEGRVMSYRREGARVVPVLAQPRNTEVLQWGLQDFRAVVLDAVRHVATVLDDRHLHVDLAAPAWDVLHAFWGSPEPAEAGAWGSFPWEEESYPPIYPIARRLTHSVLLRRLALHRGDLLPYNSWRAGAVELQRQPWRSALRLRRWADRQGPRVVHVRRRTAALAGRLPR